MKRAATAGVATVVALVLVVAGVVGVVWWRHARHSAHAGAGRRAALLVDRLGRRTPGTARARHRGPVPCRRGRVPLPRLRRGPDLRIGDGDLRRRPPVTLRLLPRDGGVGDVRPVRLRRGGGGPAHLDRRPRTGARTG